MIDKNYTKSFWSFDNNDMALEESWSWPDSLGRNAFFYIFHPDQTWLKRAILRCIKFRDDGYVQFYRYPNVGAEDQSRDHVSAVILALYLNRDWEELEMILNNLPLQLSRRYWQTPDFWLWQKAISAEIKGNEVKFQIFRNSFYLLNLLMFVIVVPWNYMIKLIVNAKCLSIDDLPINPNPNIKKWKIWVSRKLKYPNYALYNLAWMIWSLRLDGTALAYLLNLLPNNVVIQRLLINRSITSSEYESYVPMNFFQWAGDGLNSMVDRTIRRLTPEEIEFNDLMKSNLNYHYYQIDDLVRDFKPEIIKNFKIFY